MRIFMQIYLCDDSESDLLRLQHYLKSYAREKKLFFESVSFSSGELLLKTYEKSGEKPELIFLDIFMNGLSGMDTARRLRELHYEGAIIFTTSSTEHAMDSYEVNAMYYLQKPYERSHFEKAMQRCSALLRNARPRFRFLQKRKQVSVPCEDILFFETNGSHTVLLHTVSGSYSFADSLSRIAGELADNVSFLPVGRSYLIHVDQVVSYSEGELCMTDGSVIQIPLRRRAKIHSILTKES